MTKQGRNEPCQCGSGRKFKHCHGRIEANDEFRIRSERVLKRRAAAERIRIEQQGHGRPIISASVADQTVVAVGTTVYWGKWKVFADFLIEFLVSIFGREWFATERSKRLGRHPVIAWFEEFRRLASGGQPGVVREFQGNGMTSALLQLSYSLYLLAHHDHIPKLLIKRLHNITNFQPAFLETLVGAIFAVAGFAVKAAETKPFTTESSPEFRVSSKRTGKKYIAEAKLRDRWSSEKLELGDPSFEREIKKWVLNKLWDATKQLHESRDVDETPILFLDLNLPHLGSESEFRQLTDLMSECIRIHEAKAGTEQSPCYLFISNHGYLSRQMPVSPVAMAYAAAVHIPNYAQARVVPAEDALAIYDEHRDMFWLGRSFQLARQIPHTFDGSPIELLDQFGGARRPISVGDQLAYQDSDGKEQVGQIEDIVFNGKDAATVVRDLVTSARLIIMVPLTDQERKAAERFGSAVFGNPNQGRHLEQDDIFGLYDFLLESYAGMTRDSALERLKFHPLAETYAHLSDEDLVRRVAREDAKSIYGRAQSTQGTSSPSQPFGDSPRLGA